MGYTHTFTQKKATQEKWNEFVQECKLLKKELPKYTKSAGGYHRDKKILIRGCDGTGRALFNKNEVCFNGDLKRDLSHETFYCDRKFDKQFFCKTNRKPYDLLVCAVLIGAHNVLGYEVTSNGRLKDWKPAIDFYSKVIYGISIIKMGDELMEYNLPEFLYNEIKKI